MFSGKAENTVFVEILWDDNLYITAWTLELNAGLYRLGLGYFKLKTLH